MNASSIIQIDFGHRAVDVTVGDVRRWHTGEDIDGLCAALRFKRTPEAQRAALDLIRDVARQTPGAIAFDCEWCGARTYGADGVIGSRACTECDTLAGMDNQCNDEAREPDDSECEAIHEMLRTITANGGDAMRALSTCDFLAPTIDAQLDNNAIEG